MYGGNVSERGNVALWAPVFHCPLSSVDAPGLMKCMLVPHLMNLCFENKVLLLSAYSNPVETIEHARRLGYRVTDFMVTPLPFGYYSSEPKVRGLRSRAHSGCSHLLCKVVQQGTVCGAQL